MKADHKSGTDWHRPQREIITEAFTRGKRAGRREAIRVYTPYIKALEKENGSLIGFAYTHGRRSSGVEFGKQCRKKIKELKAKGKCGLCLAYLILHFTLVVCGL